MTTATQTLATVGDPGAVIRVDAKTYEYQGEHALSSKPHGTGAAAVVAYAHWICHK